MLKQINFFKRLTAPTSLNPDISRREFILNTLLIGLVILSLPVFLATFFNSFILKPYHGLNPWVSGLVLVIFILFLYLSKKGKSHFVGWLFVLLLLLVNLYISYHWGADLPESLLIYSLITVVTSILLGSKKAVFISAIIAAAILLLSYLKLQGLIQTEDRWRGEMIHLTDVFTYAVTICVISLVSWLFNREMERALKRAYRSEAALRKQRDSLEVLVEERTKELKKAQVEKVLQLYRFAQIGRSASGLFHDLVNPLTVVSLNLDKISRSKAAKNKEFTNAEVALERAVEGTKRLESFIRAARKQFQNQEILQSFSLEEEIAQSIQMLEPRSKRVGVRIVFEPKTTIKVFGNPIKFSQMVTNLIANAVDSYEKTQKSPRVVELRLESQDNKIKLTVKDWGSGIKPEHLSKIFDPLFTTKDFEKGTGIGLSLARDIIEKDFRGIIEVSSQRGKGTTFIIKFPQRKSRT